MTEARLRRWLAGAAVPAALACGSDPEVRPEEIRSRRELGELGATAAPLRELLEPSPNDPELNHPYGVALVAYRLSPRRSSRI